MFLHIKSVLEGRFANAKEITEKAMQALTEVSKDGFQECP
jgi:hypothetical protein